MNDVDYVIKTPEYRKDHRLCHINMLKDYQEREIAAESELKTISAVIIAISSLSEPPADIYPVESGVKGSKLCNSDILCNLEQKLEHLPENEQEELKTLIIEFSSVFADIPRKTTYASHDVDVGDSKPIK